MSVSFLLVKVTVLIFEILFNFCLSYYLFILNILTYLIFINKVIIFVVISFSLVIFVTQVVYEGNLT